MSHLNEPVKEFEQIVPYSITAIIPIPSSINGRHNINNKLTIAGVVREIIVIA
jgi:hypothetical protein